MVGPSRTGLLAFGQYGQWHVDISESVENSALYFTIALDHPLVTVQFSCTDLALLGRMVNFLKQLGNQVALELASYPTGQLSFVVDEERLYIMYRQRDEWQETSLMRVRVGEVAHQELILALQNVMEELDSFPEDVN